MQVSTKLLRSSVLWCDAGAKAGVLAGLHTAPDAQAGRCQLCTDEAWKLKVATLAAMAWGAIQACSQEHPTCPYDASTLWWVPTVSGAALAQPHSSDALWLLTDA